MQRAPTSRKAPAILNKAAAELLEGFADALEIRGANTFRVRAFRNAARRVDSLTTDVAELVESGEISKVRGIGKGIAGVLGEFVAKGRVDEYEEMRAEIPDSVFEMLLVPGLGPKTAATLYTTSTTSTAWTRWRRQRARDGWRASGPLAPSDRPDCSANWDGSASG